MTFDLHNLGNPQKPNFKFRVSSKAGYLFMNRAAVDEDDQCEILKIFELEKTSEKHKGTIFSTKKNHYLCSTDNKLEAML